MKKTNRLIVLLAIVLTMVACNKEKEEQRHERDITYTVNENTTTVHLTTDAEWQTLLDRFCDYAQEGNGVTFWNAKNVSKGASKDAVTFSTTNREEMKRWMAQMEEQGKTVTVTYDPATGTWNGTAYAAPPTNPEPQGACITGVLGNAPSHAMSAGVVPTGMEWTLQMGDSAIWLVNDGNFIAVDGTSLSLDDTTYYFGDSVTLCGRCLGILDYYGNLFPILILDGTYNYPMPQKNRLSATSKRKYYR